MEMELDFKSMKRKELQALCKKYGLPGNSTNLKMAESLASLLQVLPIYPLFFLLFLLVLELSLWKFTQAEIICNFCAFSFPIAVEILYLIFFPFFFNN